MRPGKMVVEVLKSLFRKVATIRYPATKFELADKYRGKLKFFPEKCIGCKMCMRDCPSNAIVITKTADGKFEAEINLGKCIYCGQCVDICPKKALECTSNVELAELDREKLKVVFRAEPPADAEKKT